MTASPRPVVVRVLHAAGWIGIVFGMIVAGLAFAKGASEGFADLAVVWAVVAAIGVLLLLAGIAALLAGIRHPAGLAAGLVACALLLLLVPVGTAVTIAIGVIASQTWPQLRSYYGLSRRGS